jgi:hypothetical protein
MHHTSDSSALAISENVLKGRKNGYFANVGIIKLNLILVLSLVSSYATGYDGSMMSASSYFMLDSELRLTDNLYQTACRALIPGRLISINQQLQILPS